MSNEEMLKKAIEKAIKNGWDYKYELKPIKIAQNKDYFYEWKIRAIIFDHDFAKAFWKDKEPICYCCSRINDKELVDGKILSVCGKEYRILLPAWQYHLQNMVISKDPIKYLAKFL